MRSGRVRDRRALLREAGNASQPQSHSSRQGHDEAQVRAGRTNRSHCRRVVRTNLGVRIAKIFRENSDSLVK